MDHTKKQADLSIEDFALLEFGETEEVKAESLERLRQLIKESALSHAPTEEEFLLANLRYRKYKVTEAFDTIKKYSQMRQQVPEFFEYLTPANIPLKEVCREGKLIMISAQPDALGRSIALVRLGAWNSGVCPFIDFVRATLVLGACVILEDVSQIRGVSGIVDMKGLSIHHLQHLTPSFLFKLVKITQDCTPMRVKAVYVINCPFVIKTLFQVVKPILKHKLLKRIHFIADDASKLWEICPRDLVPGEFGGEQENFDYIRQEQLVLRRSDFFERMCHNDHVLQVSQ